MKVEVKKIPGSKVELTITDNTKELDKARAHVIATLGKNADIKGFRKGANIPEAIILKEFGQAAIDERAINYYLDKNYSDMLDKSGITPIAAGTVTDVKSISPIEIVLEIEVLPEIEIDVKKLDKISIKKTTVKVTKDEVKAAVADIEKRFTHFHEAGHSHDDGFDASKTAIESGDRVTLSTQGYEKKDGEAILETKVQNFPLVIGSAQFIPGFEEKLIGSKTGDTVEFDIVFPEDYHSEAFKKRKVYFVSTIEKVEKPHGPTWAPEFIEKLRGVKTDMAGFEDILEKEILGEKERRAREEDEGKLLEQLEEIATYEVGTTLVSREAEAIYNEQKQNLESQGYNMKTYLQHMKMDEAQYKSEIIEKEARRRVAAELILKKVRDIRGVEASEEEIKMEINGILAQYQNADVLARLKAKLQPGDTYYEDIKNRLAYRKVVDGFFSSK